MTRRIVKNGRYWALADQMLGEWLGERDETGLIQAVAAVDKAASELVGHSGVDDGDDELFEKAEFVRQCMSGRAAGDSISRLLRARGFHKAGVTGSALTYDRQPLYRKAS
ncbi:MAG: hypothetical protein QOG72_2418 [Sphingomonadales bacterium]|jgi:hypothetical protein|nr:hypothetical protein [Sphingomonadales bacterium]